MEGREQVDVYQMIEEFDDCYKDADTLFHDDNQKAIKVIFNKMYDYEPMFRDIMYKAVSLMFGAMLHEDVNLIHRLSVIFDGGIDYVRKHHNVQ